MKKYYFILLTALLPLLTVGQTSYPYEILPGQSKTISAAQDTLWVLKHSQLQRALIAVKTNKLLNEEISVLKQKIETKSELTFETDSLVKLHQKDAEFYKNKWQESEQDIDKVVKKYKQQKLLKNIFMGGAIVTFFLGAYLL